MYLRTVLRSHGRGASSKWNRSSAVAAGPSKSKAHKVMSEHEHGTLKSGSGKKVKSRKAVAIAMLEAGQSKKRKKAS